MEPPSTRPWLGVGAALSALPAAGGCFCAALVLAVVADSDPGAVYEQHRWLGAIVAASAVCAFVAMMGWATLRHGGLPAPVLLIALALSGAPFLLPGSLFLPAAAIAVAGCAALATRRPPAPARLPRLHARAHRRAGRHRGGARDRPGDRRRAHRHDAATPGARPRRRAAPRTALQARASRAKPEKPRAATRPRPRRPGRQRPTAGGRHWLPSRSPTSRSSPPPRRTPLPTPSRSPRTRSSATTTPLSTATTSPPPGRCSRRRFSRRSAASTAGARATRSTVSHAPGDVTVTPAGAGATVGLTLRGGGSRRLRRDRRAPLRRDVAPGPHARGLARHGGERAQDQRPRAVLSRAL